MSEALFHSAAMAHTGGANTASIVIAGVALSGTNRNLAVAMCRRADGESISTITRGTDTFAGQLNANIAGVFRLDVWNSTNEPQTASADLTVTNTGAGTFWIIGYLASTNVNQSTRFQDATRNTDETPPTFTGMTVPSALRALMADVVGTYGDTFTDPTPDGSQTRRAWINNPTSTGTNLACSTLPGAATSVTLGWTACPGAAGLHVGWMHPALIEGAAALDGSGDIAASGEKASAQDAALDGTGESQATGQKGGRAAAALDGAGALAASGEKRPTQAADVSGSGDGDATGQKAASGSAALTGAGALSATGQKAVSQPASVDGAGDVTTTSHKGGERASALTGSGEGQAAGHKIGQAEALLAGAGAVEALGQKQAQQSVALSGSGDVSATGPEQELRSGSAALTGAGDVSGTGRKQATSTGHLSSSGELSGTGTKQGSGVATLTNAGKLAALGLKHVGGVVSLSGGGIPAAQGFKGELFPPAVHEWLVGVRLVAAMPYEGRQGFVIQTAVTSVEADLYFADEERDCLFTHRMT